MKIRMNCFVIGLIIVFCISYCCTESNNAPLNGQGDSSKNIEKSLYVENGLGNKYLIDYYIDVNHEIEYILKTSLNQKKMDQDEFIALKEFVHNVSLKKDGTVIILNSEGVIIAHYKSVYEMTNVDEYIEYSNGLSKLFESETNPSMILFFLKKKIYSNKYENWVQCHVAAKFIDELGIIILNMSHY